VALKAVLYAVPTDPGGGVPAITGSGLTVMLATLEFVVPLVVAVKVTFIWEVIPVGAV
jgi:hypothetical protein